MSKKIFLIIFLLVTLLITQFSTTIYATIVDTNQKASLKIVEYENAYGEGKNNSQNVPLSGVEITIYKLDEANFNNSVDEIEANLNNGTINLTSKTLTTGSDGTVIFSNLDLGRYLVVQTNSPANVSVKMESFLIDLPRTSDNGTSWNYDVTVEPKNITVYGNVTLTKFSNNGDTLPGTTWELQVKNNKSDWVKYDYNGTLTTDSNGQILVTNLPAGTYRLVELSTLPGYILDSSNTQEFTISAENTSYTLTATNEKPNIDKQVKISNGYGKSVGAYLTDTVEWKITSSVPKIINKMNTYSITDTLPNELDFVTNSLVIFAKSENTETQLILGTDYTLIQNGKTLEINFVPTNLAGYSSIYLKYNTIFNSSVQYGKSIINSSNLKYTNNIDINGNCISSDVTEPSSSEVHTGKIVILKTDINNKPLEGAKFKISSSKQDANEKKYIKDAEGNDIIGISNNEGLVTFYGLKYGNDNITASDASSSYFITEIESPTYEENGETKHYNLLSDSVEVFVNSSSGELSSTSPKVVNKKGFVLPITGATGTIVSIIIGSLFLLITIRRKRKYGKTQAK